MFYKLMLLITLQLVYLTLAGGQKYSSIPKWKKQVEFKLKYVMLDFRSINLIMK